ncbi:hypothetical protein Dsin_013015 [Dipteronia sinensis]|uniref:Uncharacterized protein n=1 Tax=Dipteronia sinensis TaxID=43782 RepID=A0AAE0AK06_9ROSI|nr:hypothetical protein Dsin_013015 [Dipteronia sinensis]
MNRVGAGAGAGRRLSWSLELELVALELIEEEGLMSLELELVVTGADRRRRTDVIGIEEEEQDAVVALWSIVEETKKHLRVELEYLSFRVLRL